MLKFEEKKIRKLNNGKLTTIIYPHIMHIIWGIKICDYL